MKFWDASAVVALLVDESGQVWARRELEEDPAMAVWWGTRVECVSAIARRERDRSTDTASTRAASGAAAEAGERMARSRADAKPFEMQRNERYAFTC